MPGGAFLLGMPGRLREGHMTVKVVTVYESNRELPTHLATIGLYDPATGACLAFMDGTYITAIRTSAAAAVAADQLAREDARTLAIIGAGVQGEHHLKTFPLVRDFDEIRISSLYPRRRASPRRAAPARARGGRSGDGGATARTWSRSPPTPRSRSSTPEWIAPGTHVSSVGYHPPDGELPRALLDRATLFVETLEAFEPPPVGCAELQGRTGAPRARRTDAGAPARTRSPSTRRWAT